MNTAALGTVTGAQMALALSKVLQPGLQSEVSAHVESLREEAHDQELGTAWDDWGGMTALQT